MSKTTLPTLPKIFSDVLGELAFVFPSEPDEDTPKPRYTLQARIAYSGAKSGMLRLRCDGRFASTIAANLLGLDPEDSAAEQARLDALKELLNVLAGNLVTELYGTEGLFELSIPEVVPVLPDQDEESLAGAEIHVFAVEDTPIELAHVVT